MLRLYIRARGPRWALAWQQVGLLGELLPVALLAKRGAMLCQKSDPLSITKHKGEDLTL